MDLSIIRNLCENRSGGMRRLASDIGMSEANLHRCVNNNKIQAADLEKIAKLLDVDIHIFFDQAGGSSANSIVNTNGDFSPASLHGNVSIHATDTLLKEKIKFLEALLAEKERLIEILMKGNGK